MNWYYVEQGKQAGPVDDAKLEEMRASGQIQPDTLIWREGMANWVPYKEAKGDGNPPVGMPMPSAVPKTGPGGEPLEAVCTECGAMFPKENMIRYGNSHVCANCKPAFMQKIAEGARLGSAGPGVLSEQQIIDGEYRVEIGRVISRAWELFTGNAGSILATGIVIGLIFIAASIVTGLISRVIPLFNTVVGFFYGTPLVAGLMWFYLRLARGESANMGDAFAGFSRKYWQLVLFGVVQFVISILCLVPFIVVLIAFGLSAVLRHGGAPPHLAEGAILAMVLTVFVSVCALCYINTSMVFSVLLIIDKGYGFWPAIQLSFKVVHKHWWMTFLFLLLGFLIVFGGALLCLVGLLVTVPLYIGMKVVLYEDNFGQLAPRN
jgi:hypothetical protein